MKKIFIKIELAYNTVLVSGVQISTYRIVIVFPFESPLPLGSSPPPGAKTLKFAGIWVSVMSFITPEVIYETYVKYHGVILAF